jgi:hypothetical protein
MACSLGILLKASIPSSNVDFSVPQRVLIQSLAKEREKGTHVLYPVVARTTPPPLASTAYDRTAEGIGRSDTSAPSIRLQGTYSPDRPLPSPSLAVIHHLRVAEELSILCRPIETRPRSFERSSWM